MSIREKIVGVYNTYLISPTKDESLSNIEQLQQPESNFTIKQYSINQNPPPLLPLPDLLHFQSVSWHAS